MMGLFSKLLKRRKQMMPSRTGMLRRLRGLGSLKNRMRPARPIFFGGNRSLFPFSSISNLPRRDMPLPPNLDVVTDEPIRDLDIMPRDAVMPKQPPQIGVAPDMTRGNAALLPPDIAPLPPKPMMGVNMGMPNFMSAGQPPKMVMGMKEGGDVDAEKEYPNKGLAALAASGPGGKKAVKAMGYAEGMEVVANPIPGIDMPSGSDADMMNYQNTLMALREMKASLPIDQQPFFDSAIREILGESGRTISNMDQMMIQDMLDDMADPEKKSLMSPSGM